MMKLEKGLITQCLLLLTSAASTLTLAQDNDFDGLEDDWEILNGRDPLIADYGIAMGDTWLCIKSDGGVHCNGSAYPSSPVFTVSTGKTEYIYEQSECSHNEPGENDYSHDIKVESGISGNPTALNVSVEYFQVAVVTTGPGGCLLATGSAANTDYFVFSDASVAQVHQTARYDRYNTYNDEEEYIATLCYLDDMGVSCMQWNTYTSSGGFFPSVEFKGEWSPTSLPSGTYFDADRDGIPNHNDQSPFTANSLPLDGVYKGNRAIIKN